jgi:hypothetical protein
MKRVHGWTLALLVLTPLGRVLGCSCDPSAEAPACEKISTAEIVFVGTVRAIEPDAQFPAASKSRVYRLQVDTPYKGLPQNVAEVVVNPDNFTSCQTEYKRGVRYLIFATRLAGTSEVLSGGCHGSRIADDAGEDLRFLEAYRSNQATNSVYGRVLQWVTDFGRPRREEDASVAGADVVLSNGVRTFTKRTTETGDFRFEGIPAGAYNLSAHLAPYISNPTPLPIEVPAAGCVERFPKLEARASLSGILTTQDGHPAAKERVELLRRNQKGSWYATYQFWTQTDAQGRFKFEDLPDGDYLLGYGIWNGKPSVYSPYATRYFPGVPERAHASMVHLMPMQALNDLKFSLARPHTPRSIRVEVVWPNGTAPKQNLLQLFDGDELIKNVGLSLRDQPGATHNGIVEFTGYAEREYDLHVRYWIDDLGGPVPHDQQRIARSDKVRLPPGDKPATVRIVLTKTLLSDEDR